MLASAVPLLLIIVAIVIMAATGNLLSTSPAIIALQVAAIALNLWARTAFQRGTFRVTAAPGGTTVIRTGPYRFIRHPMYAAALLFVWASVVGHPTLLTYSIGLVVTALAVARVMVEDRLLIAHLPGYADYARTTKALIPFLF